MQYDTPTGRLKIQLVLFLPLIWILLLALLTSFAPTGQEGVSDSAGTNKAPGRVVLIIVDSLRRQALVEHMPKLSAWGKQPNVIDRDVLTCSANYTVPCVQTIMEGRQSPFVAGLHNFTGKKGSDASLPAQIKRSGLYQVLISDFTLDTLYGTQATVSHNVEGWPGNILMHDQASIKKAKSHLADPKLNVLVLHLIGTDKVAHRKTPGHPEYIRHFEAVDADLITLLDTLQPNDHIIITGDHGHDQKGHHNRDSMALIRSPVVSHLLGPGFDKNQRLEQHELTYLLWATLGLPASPAYEGRYFGVETQPLKTTDELASYFQSFQNVQKKSLEEAGFKGKTLSDQINAKRTHMKRAPLRDALQYSPLVIMCLWWLFWIILQINAPKTWLTPTLATCMGSILVLGAGIALPAWSMGVLALFLLMAMVKTLWPHTNTDTQRHLSWLIILLVMASLTALAGPRWAGFWHTRGGFTIQIPLFFVGLSALGLIGSKCRTGQWWKALPESLGAVCLIVLPSGVYFYQYGQNIVRGLFIGAAFLIVGVLINAIKTKTKPAFIKTWGKRQYWALFLLTICGGYLMHQTAGGWEWHFVLTRSLKRSHKAIPILIYCGIGLAILPLLHAPNRRKIASYLTLWSLPLFYSAGVGELTLPTLAGVSMPLGFAAAFLTLTEQPILRTDKKHHHERMGWWLLAIGLITYWIILSGFFIGQVDFNFTFPYLNMFKTEAVIAFWSSWMTFFKYTFPAWIWVFIVFWQHEDWHKMIVWFWVLLQLKCLALFLQIFTGPLISEQKLFELTISELLFTMNLGWIVMIAMFIIYIADRFKTSRQTLE